MKGEEEQKVGERQKVGQWWNRQRSWYKTIVFGSGVTGVGTSGYEDCGDSYMSQVRCTSGCKWGG